MNKSEPEFKKLLDDDFLRFISSAGGFCWWKKSGDKEIVFLNDTLTDSREKQNFDKKNLLMDLIWAQQVVVEEDFFRFKLFIQSMRHGQEATAVFRLNDNQGRRLWWRIAGAPGHDNPANYYGFIHDISENVSLINHLLEKDLARETMIETDDRPVLLIDMDSKHIVSCNTPACQLLGLSYQEFHQVNFLDIFAQEQLPQAPKIYETCILEGNWKGLTTILSKGGLPLEVKMKIKRLCLRERNLLRITIVDVNKKSDFDQEQQSTEALNREQLLRSLTVAVENKTTLPEILDLLLDRRFNDSLFDAVIYADVNIKKDAVDIYANGEAFKPLNPVTSYNYEGIISPLFRDNNADYVILSDTLESTKPIDWALFIPFGIRSYLVKPFYHGGKLRTLLILCSTEPDGFSDSDIEFYEIYFQVFVKGLRNWRKSKRK